MLIGGGGLWVFGGICYRFYHDKKDVLIATVFVYIYIYIVLCCKLFYLLPVTLYINRTRSSGGNGLPLSM